MIPLRGAWPHSGALTREPTMQDTDVQQDFDQLVTVAEAWLTANDHSPKERELYEKIEAARQRDEDFAEAAIELAAQRVAPDLVWFT